MVSFTQNRFGVCAAVVIALISVSTLAGCSPAHTLPVITKPAASGTPAASASASATASVAPSASASAVAPAPSPSATTATPAVAVTVACNTLVSPQTMYNFNPNFTLQAGFVPTAGSAGGSAIASKGVACGWINNTSKDSLVVSAARPGSQTFATAKAAASGGTAVAGLGDTAYFSTTNGAGRLDAFSGTYWVTATSNYFSSASDASPLISAALSALK